MDRDISLEAAKWLRMLPNWSTEDANAFGDWVRLSPDHIKEFIAVALVSDEIDRLDWRNVPEIDAILRGSADNVIALPTLPITHPSVASRHPTLKPERKRSSRWGRLELIGTAAAILGFVLIGCWKLLDTATTYSTALGEQKTVQLEDGSIMSLNARSNAVVRYAEGSREVMLRGEGFFRVASDPARPFRVVSGDTQAVALGTEFNVQSRSTGTRIAVLEGAVQVGPSKENRLSTALASPDATVVAAGEQINIAPNGTAQKSPIADAAEVTAWQKQILVFRNDRLEDIVTEFNRWNDRQLRIQGDTTHLDTFDGVFRAGDPESLLQFLGLQDSIRIDRRKDGVIIHVNERPTPTVL